MLTREDHMIFRARMSVAAQAALHKIDRADAHTMRLGVHGLLCRCGSVRSVVTLDCVRGKHCEEA